MSVQNLKSVSSFLDTAYREGLKCLDKEKLSRILDLKAEVDEDLLKEQRKSLEEM